MPEKKTQIEFLKVYSISYEKANATTRGRFSFFLEQVDDFSEQIKAQNAGFGFIVSTCNRTEIYTYSKKSEIWVETFCQFAQVSLGEFEAYSTLKEGKEALNHLFNVSAGLDSQILGDFEIISQLKKWVRKFKKQNLTNHFIEKAVNTSLQISKKIKSNTQISSGTASVSFSAVNYLMQSEQKIHKIVLIGTGKIGQNTCQNLIKHFPKVEIVVLNRTEEKAEKLAQKYHIQHKKLSEIESELIHADAVIVSTNSPEAVVAEKHIQKRKTALIILDLSIPNNVEKKVATNENITLLNVDDLSKLVDETLEIRRNDIPKAQKIIHHFTEEFLMWEESRKYAPFIHQFKENLDFINTYNTKELAKKDIKINGKETILAEKLAQKITNRFADFILENPEKAAETTALFNTIFHLQKKENENH